ncbi:unnamed protein product [Bemisia tabaci]|uniref:Ionotropic receptor n=1 Tax=Bemisia tabaci TaxID=7038 RepID=A0A9P0EZR2_BEMTA|nr:unnamed protein product [Bemisia tabaci]
MTLETDLSGALTFCFKFFWRFFKGHKAIICHPNGCERYDPFTGSLISFKGWDDTENAFLDFSWGNMHKKPLKAMMDFSGQKGSRIFIRPWSNWVPFHITIIEHLESSLNCTLTYQDLPALGAADFYYETDESLKLGFDLVMFQNGIMSEKTDYSRLDFSVCVDTNVLGIVAPRSGFMSQGLVVFESFTPFVWVSISITILALCCVQYIFQHSQSELFRRLYTDAEIDYYRGTSSLLTVYAYFICGFPPSLHLGRLLTGKIIFVLFSFSALILSTAFLGSMTTLLSRRVKYPEIESLTTLEESDLFVQSFEYSREEVVSLFDQLNQSNVLEGKLIDTLRYYILDLIGRDVLLDKRFTYNGTKSEDLFAEVKGIYGDLIEEAEENVRSVAEADAFLLAEPLSALTIKYIRVKHLFKDEWFEYHVMKEYIMTYPLIIAFMKNSFYFEKCNEIIARYLETGHAGLILNNATWSWTKEPTAADEGREAPREFDLNDLQSAFIGLIIGLFLSFLIFVGELIFGIFPNSAAVKFLMRLMNPFEGLAKCILEFF